MAYGELTFTPQANAAGVAVVSVKVRNGLDTWTISQVSLSWPTAPTGATCFVQKNGFPVSPAIPTGDTLADAPPVMLRPSDELTVTWAGLTAGTTGQVLVFFDDGLV